MKNLLFFLFVAVHAVEHTIAGVGFVKQETRYCGPASLSSVLAFYGVDIDQQTIGKVTYNKALEGVLITDLANFAADHRFQVKMGQGTIPEMKDFVLQNKPIIVLVDMGYWFISKPHYLVIFGYDEQGLITHDGYEESKRFSYEKFEAMWEKMGKIFLIVYR